MKSLKTDLYQYFYYGRLWGFPSKLFKWGSKENFEEEILEESESVSGGEMKGEMKSAVNKPNDSINERDGSILNIGSDGKVLAKSIYCSNMHLLNNLNV